MTYRVIVPQTLADTLRHAHPDLKKGMRTACDTLSSNPYVGKALQQELSGFWFYRFLRYRIVYKVDEGTKTVFLFAVAHRRDVYESVYDLLHQ